jgi:hypothetical protein
MDVLYQLSYDGIMFLLLGGVFLQRRSLRSSLRALLTVPYGYASLRCSGLTQISSFAKSLGMTQLVLGLFRTF